MPFWPFFMGAAAVLTLWGLFAGAWKVPALALAGYFGMRAIMWWVAPEFQEVAACTFWLCIAALMVYVGGHIPGFFFALSAMTYVALLTFGFKIEYLGLTAIVAEVFAILALTSIGGGLFGISHSPADSRRPLVWFVDHSVGVAVRQKS